MKILVEAKAVKEMAMAILPDPILRMAVNAVVDATAQAEEVHGRWEYEGFDVYRCSICGACSHVKEVMGKPDWAFCPICGKPMDQEA